MNITNGTSYVGVSGPNILGNHRELGHASMGLLFPCIKCG